MTAPSDNLNLDRYDASQRSRYNNDEIGSLLLIAVAIAIAFALGCIF